MNSHTMILKLFTGGDQNYILRTSMHVRIKHVIDFMWSGMSQQGLTSQRLGLEW